MAPTLPPAPSMGSRAREGGGGGVVLGSQGEESVSLQL